MSDSQNHYGSEYEVEAIVRGFENCTLLPSEFSHPAHLLVAFSYLHRLRLTVPEATERMRAGLYRFLDHYGPDRQMYNETITLFWIKLVRSFLNRADTTRPVEDLANEMVNVYGNAQIIFDYYSKERLMSEEARQAWIEPDIKPLSF